MIELANVFVIGVGPGSSEYITNIATRIIQNADIVAGYEFTLKTIRSLIQNKEVHIVTLENQESIYKKIKKKIGNKKLVIPFTGDVNFSESEIVDRLIEIFGDVKIIPGISSIQIAAAKAHIPLDKSKIITFHVSTSIENKKIELQNAILDDLNLIILPRPWPKQSKKHFMPSEIAIYLKKHGFDTNKLQTYVYEALTTDDQKIFKGTVQDLENKEFSSLSVMIIKQTKLESYINLVK